MMHTWLLMIMLCSGTGACEELAIDEFESSAQCEAARYRAYIKQQSIESDGVVTFSCQREGEKRV